MIKICNNYHKNINLNGITNLKVEIEGKNELLIENYPRINNFLSYISHIFLEKSKTISSLAKI